MPDPVDGAHVGGKSPCEQHGIDQRIEPGGGANLAVTADIDPRSGKFRPPVATGENSGVTGIELVLVEVA